jgi:hypothetical protein
MRMVTTFVRQSLFLKIREGQSQHLGSLQCVDTHAKILQLITLDS